MGHGVVVAGEPGVGKTRLAEAATDVLGRRGAGVVRVVGTPSLQSVALGALAWLLPALDNDADDELPSASPPAASNADRLAAACAALGQHADGADLVVVLDDAQWLDDATLAVARQLLLARSAALLVTLRTGEPAAELITSLWRDELCERLDLQPLSARQVGELAAHRLGGPVDPETIARLTSVTAGNPLYLRELLDGLVHAGGLSPVEGQWVWRGDVVIDDRLAELLMLRANRLSPAARGLAVAVAVAEVLPDDTVARLAEPAVVREAHRQGVLVTDRQHRPTVRLKHPLLGRVLANSVPDRRLPLRQVVTALRSGTHHTDADLVRLARWGVETGDADAEDLATAARLLAVVDHERATGFAAAAVEARDTLANRLLHIETLVSALRYDEALRALDVVDKRIAARSDDAPADDLDSDTARATADLWRISCLGWGERDLPGVRAVVDGFPPDHPARARLEAHWSAVVATYGSTEASARAAELISHPDPAVSLRALAAADLVDCLEGRCVSCYERAEQLLFAAAARGDAERKARWVMAPLLRSLLLAGRIDDFGQYLDLAVEQVSPRALPPAYVALPQGRYALVQGRALEAVDRLGLAVEQARQGQVEPWWHRFAAASLSKAYALVGRVDESVALAEESERVAATLGLVGPRPEDLDSRRELLWTTAASQGVAAGRSAAEAEVQHCVEVAAPMFELLARHDAIRLGSSPSDHLDRLAELLVTIEGAWPEPIELHARGLATGDGALLERSVELMAEMGAWLQAAEVAAQAAAAYEKAGDGAGQRRLLTRAGALAALCEGVVRPVSPAAPEPAGLTARERDIARRAAAGMSSRAIAEELFVSVRTVDNHLGRIYAKLGVKSRAELHAHADRFGTP
jgi:DNA-binding CsgD family transcriptional regulator